MTTGSGQDRQQPPLPRRGEQPHGQIPTRYAPGSGRLRARARHVARSAARSAAVRIRPGAPIPPMPEPQQGTAPSSGAARTATTFAIRPGLPTDPKPEGAPAAADWDGPSADNPAPPRRRRVRRLALVLVLLGAAGTAVAVALSPHPHATATPAPAHSPAASASSATPSAPPSSAPAAPPAQPTPSPTLLDPLALLSSAATDKAPLSAATLFPGTRITVGNHVYTQALTATSNCAAATSAPLAAVLAKNGCQGVFRATYGNGAAEVTVGIAVFDSAAQATAVKQQATAGNLQSLFGGAVKPFCRGEVCRLSANAIGRYAYFTVAGYPTGKPVPANDKAALAASNDLAALAFQTLADRGRAEAGVH
ncbi:hypothetical protein ABIA32_001453 [Streptacidiphilus sp. MAP12-20]|uniref:hypothetical protein n=1 Tax=Streptacidiphilus sp. MAP12-20 TaxID=3156299 RepID=UPI00351308C5